MAIPSSEQLREVFNDNAVTQLDNIIDVFTDVNHSSGAFTRQRTYDNPISIANGCIDSMGFEKALSNDIVSHRESLNDTVATTGCTRRSYFYRTLQDTVGRCLDEGGAYGALDAVVKTKNQEQAQRCRTKTFARHWISNISTYYNNNHIEGNNYVEINNEDGTDGYIAFTVAGIGLIYSHTYNRMYVIFNQYPYSYIRSLLRGDGYTKAGTNNLWYNDNIAINSAADFSAYTNQFFTAMQGAYDLKAAEARVISSSIAGCITTPEQSAPDQSAPRRRRGRRNQ